MAYTPMFEKLINTKPERELCLKFLGFLKEKGLLTMTLTRKKLLLNSSTLTLSRRKTNEKY